MWIVILALAVLPAARLSGQMLTVKAQGDALHVRAPGFSVIETAVLDRLKDGRSARLDFELAVLGRPKGQVVAHDRKSFTLSLDIWEERFAVSRVGTPPRSISHLRQADAEAWCLDNLAVPLAALGRYGRDLPFWIRLAYEVPDQDATADANAEAGFSLRGLIDRLSRRPRVVETGKSLEAGPFRLSN